MGDFIILIIIIVIILSIGTYIDLKMRKFMKKVDEDKRRNEHILKALQLVMKNEMLSIFQEADAKHYTNESQRNKFYSTHALYEALGANGVVDGVVKKFDNLPTEAEIMVSNPKLFEKAMRQEGRWLQADFSCVPFTEEGKYDRFYRKEPEDEPSK